VKLEAKGRLGSTLETTSWGDYNKKMASRKVAVKIGQDILRWGT